jgi:hypothetical protein
MAALNGAVKVFIVERLACFDTPTEVQKAVKQAFKVDVSLPQLAIYNPKSASGARLRKDLKDVFEATRAKFLADTSDIAISHKAYRLRVLDQSLVTAMKQGNTAMVTQLLEQAAKEEGGAFTNKQKLEHAGKDGAPLTVVVRRFGNGAGTANG